ncbi:hypothetical protein K449DRAFT_436881 [Hypoxylon sp. EC38]|nr:hypothetical protein K449DRAFT_436881 [Hypoxylon sp. EC38]
MLFLYRPFHEKNRPSNFSLGGHNLHRRHHHLSKLRIIFWSPYYIPKNTMIFYPGHEQCKAEDNFLFMANAKEPACSLEHKPEPPPRPEPPTPNPPGPDDRNITNT